MDGLLYEPLKYYTTVAKATHAENVSQRFEELVKRSGIDVEENRKSAAAYRAALERVSEVERRLRRLKLLRGLLIALTIIGGIAAIYGALAVTETLTVGLSLILGGLTVCALCLTLILTVLRRRIRQADDLKREREEEAQKKLRICEEQMAPLVALFDSTDTHRLIEKTMPEITFAPRYTQEHQQLLLEEYDYVDLTDDDTSVTDALAGTLCGNPFLYERFTAMQMGTETYHGALTIHWTETVRDSKGNTHRVHRSQTLHASVTKPKPYYRTCTHLGYGTQAAPDLSFTRNESDTDELSDRALARRIRRGEKKLQKRTEQAATKGGSFHEMANTEFDVLFGALNRNHEVQFRLMYTPLAQTNTVDLLRSKEGYGDDFNFIKSGRFNIIKSVHAQGFEMNTSPSHYVSYDVDLAQESYQRFNEEYFKSVFFDFAPLLAVPAYQEPPTPSMRKVKAYESAYTPYEHEILANAIGMRALSHPASATDAILKTAVLETRDGVDRVRVTAYSYRTEGHTDFIPVLGGDGRTHAVPVPWLEYIPVSSASDMAVGRVGESDGEIRDKRRKAPFPAGAAVRHGLMAYLPSVGESTDAVVSVFNKYM